MYQSSLTITAKEAACLMLHSWCKGFSSISHAVKNLNIVEQKEQKLCEKNVPAWYGTRQWEDVKEV